MEYVNVQYIGDPDPLDEVTRVKMLMGQIPAAAAAIIRKAGIKRCKATEGVNRRIVDPVSFGTSQTYEFGPNTFIVSMPKSDYLEIKKTTSGHQFILEGDQLIIPRGGDNFLHVVDERNYTPEEFTKTFGRL